MNSLATTTEKIFSVELLRDQHVVVRRSGGDLEALKRAHAKMREILKTMPRNAVDTVAEIREFRDSGRRSWLP